MNFFQSIPQYQVSLTFPPYSPKPDTTSLTNIYINTFKYGFLPTEIAEDRAVPLMQIIKSHFQSRSTKRVRFEHKLWNALCLTNTNPNMFCVIGVMWISNTILKVHRTIFANLLAITKPTAALFNIQGSFPSHGFVEIDINEARKEVDPSYLTDVDSVQIRLFRHKNLSFTAFSGIEGLLNCRWKENFA